MSASSTFLAYLLWIGLCVLAGWLLWTFYSVLMLAATLWLSSNAPRPLGWTIRTSVAISKALILILGGFGLGWMLWMEREINQAARGRGLWRLVARRAGWMAALLAGLYVVAYLLSRL